MLEYIFEVFDNCPYTTFYTEDILKQAVVPYKSYIFLVYRILCNFSFSFDHVSTSATSPMYRCRLLSIGGMLMTVQDVEERTSSYKCIQEHFLNVVCTTQVSMSNLTGLLLIVFKVIIIIYLNCIQSALMKSTNIQFCASAS